MIIISADGPYYFSVCKKQTTVCSVESTEGFPVSKGKELELSFKLPVRLPDKVEKGYSAQVRHCMRRDERDTAGDKLKWILRRFSFIYFSFSPFFLFPFSSWIC